MAKFVVMMEGAFLGEYLLDKKRFVIGRLPQCDIQIDNLAVSGQHALVSKKRNKLTIKDLESTNGTTINGQRVSEEHVLAHADVIEIGKYQLKYVEQDVAPDKNGLIEKTVLVQSMKDKPKGGAKAIVDTQEIKAASAIYTTQGTVGIVRILTGNHLGKEMVLSGKRLTLGKSGKHTAEIVREESGYFIQQLMGNKVLTVNSLPVGETLHLLKHEDKIELSGVKMLFLIERPRSFFTKCMDFIKSVF